MVAHARLLDSAAGFLNGSHLRAAGVDGASVWTSPARPGSGLAKPSMRPDVDSIRSAGKAIFTNFQFGKPGASMGSDYTHGFSGGRDNGLASLAAHQQLGGPTGAPHYFSIDEDIVAGDWPLAADWLRGCAWALGVERVGVYGSRRALEWARRDGVASWFWQARGWRYEGYLDWAHLHQVQIDVRVDGVPFAVDINEAAAPRYGAWHEFTGAATDEARLWSEIRAQQCGGQ